MDDREANRRKIEEYLKQAVEDDESRRLGAGTMHIPNEMDQQKIPLPGKTGKVKSTRIEGEWGDGKDEEWLKEAFKRQRDFRTDAHQAVVVSPEPEEATVRQSSTRRALIFWSFVVGTFLLCVLAASLVIALA